MDDKVREYVNQVLDYVWTHRGAHFNIGRMFPDDSPPRFQFFFDYDVRTEPYIEYEGNRNWSTCQKCTEMNLLILLDELKKLEDVGKKLINDDSDIRVIECSTYPVTNVRERGI